MDSEKQPITEDDIFECRQCGDCCKGFGGTYVTAHDIVRMSSYIGFDPDRFTARYCENSGSRHVLACGEDGYCIFFDKKKQCAIHPVKPYMCKAWPFIEAVLRHPENWNMMANSCPGMKKDSPKEALEKIVTREKEKLNMSIRKMNFQISQPVSDG
ncbi:MAG: Fe-S oxidoreductase [Desulfobacula sp. RIFOXYA12_FULL_46_16]|nr:MAG: Fe-S oxidoreductase [Desulfobacula sp. RIFOXYA12_FULL_46_16]